MLGHSLPRNMRQKKKLYIKQKGKNGNLTFTISLILLQIEMTKNLHHRYSTIVTF